jgi:hypothetical protein
MSVGPHRPAHALLSGHVDDLVPRRVPVVSVSTPFCTPWLLCYGQSPAAGTPIRAADQEAGRRLATDV